MNLEEQIKIMKQEAYKLSSSSIDTRNKILQNLISALLQNKEDIFIANDTDIKNATDNNISQNIIKRLKFDENKLNDCIACLNSLINLDDPLGKTLITRELDKDILLYKETCPIGVIGIIFEARPDALIQIAGLCIKSGNCAVIKGGSEALNTNKILFNLVMSSILSVGLCKNLYLLLTSRDEVSDILACHKSIDLIIPRGSNDFVSYIMNNTKIPVMGHADGVCHIFVDEDIDLDMALNIIVDAKTQYCVACNAVETLLVHKNIAKTFLPKLKDVLDKNKVTIKGDKQVQQIIACTKADESDYTKEYSDFIISIFIVDDIYTAINHINTYGSHHTDAIISNIADNVTTFMDKVDSAGVYHNISTRFADGFRYGFGAEVGISTGKLHARGPVGLDGLTTYKYKLYGHGNIVSDYASNKKQFHFKDIQKE